MLWSTLKHLSKLGRKKKVKMYTISNLTCHSFKKSFFEHLLCVKHHLQYQIHNNTNKAFRLIEFVL